MNGQKKRRLSDRAKISIFRWWFVGAMYFLIAWGTPLGNAASPLDLIFALGVGIGFGMIFIFDPIVRALFGARRGGGTKRRPILRGAAAKLLEIGKCLFITVLVFLTYQAVNYFAVALFALPEGSILLRGEPVVFSLFFMGFYTILARLADKVRSLSGEEKEGQP